MYIEKEVSSSNNKTKMWGNLALDLGIPMELIKNDDFMDRFYKVVRWIASDSSNKQLEKFANDTLDGYRGKRIDENTYEKILEELKKHNKFLDSKQLDRNRAPHYAIFVDKEEEKVYIQSFFQDNDFRNKDKGFTHMFDCYSFQDDYMVALLRTEGFDSHMTPKYGNNSIDKYVYKYNKLISKKEIKDGEIQIPKQR